MTPPDESQSKIPARRSLNSALAPILKFLSTWNSLAVFILGLLLGGVLGAALIGAYLPDTGQWLRDFVMNNGTGFLAIIAAYIAYESMKRQIAAAGKVAQANSWWEMFEWASNRAIPHDTSHRALPVSSITGTLTQLVNDATSDAQRTACGGVVSLLAAQSEDNPFSAHTERTNELTSEVEPVSTHDADSSSDNEAAVASLKYHTLANLFAAQNDEEAFAAYADASRGTAAESFAVEDHVYRNNVTRVIAENFRFDAPDNYEKKCGAVLAVLTEEPGRIPVFLDRPKQTSRLKVERAHRMRLLLKNRSSAVQIYEKSKVQFFPEDDMGKLVSIKWGGAHDTPRLLDELKKLGVAPRESQDSKNG